MTEKKSFLFFVLSSVIVAAFACHFALPAAGKKGENVSFLLRATFFLFLANVTRKILGSADFLAHNTLLSRLALCPPEPYLQYTVYVLCRVYVRVQIVVGDIQPHSCFNWILFRFHAFFPRCDSNIFRRRGMSKDRSRKASQRRERERGAKCKSGEIRKKFLFV